MINLGIFIFRRDMRLNDNIGLQLLYNECDKIMPIFILDNKQIEITKKNKNYFSNSAVQFICESLKDLDKQLNKKDSKLWLFHGNYYKIIESIIINLKNKFNLIIGFNKDFSMYSIKRDTNIINLCNRYNIKIINTDMDYTLRPIKELLKIDVAYKQFGAFYKNAIINEPNKPFKLDGINKFIKKNFKIEVLEYKINKIGNFYKENINIAQKGGRKELIRKLKLIKNFNDYNDKRNLLSYTTTGISAGLNMGCISIRETYWYTKKILGIETDIIKQLYWRDFYLCAYIYLENAKSFNSLIDSRYNLINWSVNDIQKIYWKKMISAKTGFLIIDAAIMEMKITGFLHNRCRMILGIFWTKYLQINILDPKYGSQCGFSKYLVDAIGPSQNKMNHHWILDFDFPGKKFSAPNAPLSGRPMDISNIIIKKLDPECIYIKRWLPHLQNIDNKDLFKWSVDISNKYNNIHPSPIFDHKKQYQKWIDLCYNIK